MHVAAQSDQPLILAYFYELGLSITGKDIKGGKESRKGGK